MELSLEASVDWIKLNHNSVGYYIVNYTEDDWDKFSKLLSHDHRVRIIIFQRALSLLRLIILCDSIIILLVSEHLQILSATNRADLLHDAILLAETDLNYSTVMNLSSYLIMEESYQPWVVAAEWFDEMDRLLDGTRLIARFQVARSYNIIINVKMHDHCIFITYELLLVIREGSCQ